MCLRAGGAACLARYGGLGAVPALAEFLGPLPMFLCELLLVLPALRGPVPGLVVLPASFPRGFRVLGFGGRRSLPVIFGLRLREFLPGACGLLGSCAWPAGQREGVLERNSFKILCGASGYNELIRGTLAELSSRVRGVEMTVEVVPADAGRSPAGAGSAFGWSMTVNSIGGTPRRRGGSHTGH